MNLPNLQTLIGSNLGEVFKDVVSSFKLDPAKKAEMLEAADANKTAIEQKQLDLDGKVQDAIASEVQSAAEVIKAEAQSQSWLPRNVRPLCLLMWASLITANYLAPNIARAFGVLWTPIPLDPWIYKLTAIGFTGYVTARTWEKVAASG